MRLLLITIVLVFISGAVSAQSKSKRKIAKKKEVGKEQSTRPGPTSYSPFSPEETHANLQKHSSKKSRKGRKKTSLNQTFDLKIEEFEKRLVANAKKYRKMEKEMRKPQYSDPSYFGHKKKPKIRKVGKRKFCKECGIVH